MNQPHRLLVVALLLTLLAGGGWAGTTNLDRLTLQPEAASGDAFVVNNSSGTEVYAIDNAGVLTTAGAETKTADLTMSGAGIDILANADNQNDIGTEATSFAEGYFKVLDADTSINSDGTLDVAGTFTATGGVDFSTASSIDLSGAAPDFGSNVPTMVTSRTLYFNAGGSLVCGPADIEIKNGKATCAIADAAADEFVYFSFITPDDLDVSDSMGFVQIEYLCDQATPTEGEFNVAWGSFADDEADAALTGLGDLLDTSPAQNDWSVTSVGTAGNIPAGSFVAGEVMYISVGHDVADPLCGAQDINIANVRVTYTTDQIGN